MTDQTTELPNEFDDDKLATATVEHEELTDGPDALPIDEAEKVDDGDAAANPGAKRPANDAKVARKAIAKFIELGDATAEQLSILALLSGTKPDAGELAVTITTGARIPTGPVAELLELSELASSDPLEAMFAALGLDRDAAKLQWSLLSTFGIASGNLPTKDRDAAKALIKAASSISSAERQVLESVRTLARK